MKPQPIPHVLFTRDEIKNAVQGISQEITRDYHNKHPLLIGVLKGSFVFMADLIRLLNIPLELEFVQLSSYGRTKQSTGRVTIVHGLRTPIRGRDILIIEDIVDTGLTINYLINHLQQGNPSSIKLCALLDKPSQRKIPVSIDYLGFAVPDRFIVGYGIDYNEQFRYLPDICILGE